MTVDIAALRALIAAATEGPWSLDLNTYTDDNGEEYWDVDGSVGGGWIAHVGELEDARFLTAARDALPAALDEIERLQAEVERLRSNFPPHRLEELRQDLDEAAAVAEVHAGVRCALNAGLTLLAEVERLNRAEGADRA